jgi:hypothetical protein
MVTADAAMGAVYKLPPFVMVMELMVPVVESVVVSTAPVANVATNEAPVPVPVRFVLAVGGVVYPAPPLVSVKPVMGPVAAVPPMAVTVTTALVVPPVKLRVLPTA